MDSSSSWRELQREDQIQFDEVIVPPEPPREPNWFDDLLAWLAELLAPVGNLLVSSWPVLQWVLLALVVAALGLLAWRIILQGRLSLATGKSGSPGEDITWAPDQAESLALLSDADALAAEGRFDEATHLLLKRSVGQIAAARPDWVVPSSTARELVALPNLSDTARSAFQTIAERVERSLFALRSLDRTDWEAAREAYANFALARIEQRGASS